MNNPFIVPVVFIAQYIWRLFFMYTNFEAFSTKSPDITKRINIDILQSDLLTP